MHVECISCERKIYGIKRKIIESTEDHRGDSEV